jgi:hypothetical protein
VALVHVRERCVAVSPVAHDAYAQVTAYATGYSPFKPNQPPPSCSMLSACAM